MEEALPTLAGNKLSTALFVNSILPPRYAGEHKSPETDLMQKAVFASWIPIIDGYPVIPKFRCDLVGETTAFDLEMVEHTFTLERTQAEECLESKIGKTLIPGLFRGESATVMLYGQSGIGKEELFSGDGSRLPNIVDWCASKIFSEIPENCEVVLSVAMMKIYHEKLIDCIPVIPKDAYHPPQENLRIKEYANTPGNRLSVEMQTHLPASSLEEFRTIVKKGNRNIAIWETCMSEMSTRDWRIITISVEGIRKDSSDGGAKGQTFSSVLNLVRSPGVERVSRQIHQPELRTTYAGLLALKRCWNARATKANFVPYRDCKITRLLQNAIRGDDRFLLLAMVSPRTDYMIEVPDIIKLIRDIETTTSSIKPCVDVPTALFEFCRNKEPRVETLTSDPLTLETTYTDSDLEVLLNDPCRRSIVGKRFHRGCILKGTKKQQQ